jgi:hypothetical protein
MAKQYETLVRNYVCSTYEDRTLRHILNVCKSLAKYIFQQKINPKSAWPSTVDRTERHETIVSSFLTFWSTYDASNDADVPSEANLYAKPQYYMKWLHFIQKEMEQKKFIQEMKPQDKASSIFVYKSKHDNESPPPPKDLQKTNGAPGFNALSITAVHSLTPR